MCQDFKLVAKDGTCIVCRTMQLAWDCSFQIRTRPRSHKYSIPRIRGKQPYSFTNKYGYLYIDTGLKDDFCNDGMNEHGLCFEYLNLKLLNNIPEPAPPGLEQSCLPLFLLGDFILGRFRTCRQFMQFNSSAERIRFVREGIDESFTFACQPYHAAVHDREGMTIAIQYIDGVMHVFVNELGLLTNAPGFEWQMQNLAHYEHLTNEAPSLEKYGVASIGQPGDTSPGSRFAKFAILLKHCGQPQTASEALIQGQHIINQFDIARGMNLTYDAKDKTQLLVNISMWSNYKDMTNLVLYYKTYEDMALRKIDMKRLSFEEDAAPLCMPLRSYKYGGRRVGLNQ